MHHGFKLSVEGKIGDGCGGGRIFYIENETLYAFDPITKNSIALLQGIKDAYSIQKSGCVIMIQTKDGEVLFNLSTFQRETQK